MGGCTRRGVYPLFLNQVFVATSLGQALIEEGKKTGTGADSESRDGGAGVDVGSGKLGQAVCGAFWGFLVVNWRHKGNFAKNVWCG